MTRREWFETLPPAYAERAIRNTTTVQDLDDVCTSLHYAVSCGFVWSGTPEGFRFWRRVRDGELPPIPGAESTPEPAPALPEPPLPGFAVVMGPLAVAATLEQQNDVVAYRGAGRGWQELPVGNLSDYWVGMDEAPYALRINSQIAIDNGVPVAPVVRYFHVPDSYGVWRATGETVEIAPDETEDTFLGPHRVVWGESAYDLDYLLRGGATRSIREFFPETHQVPSPARNPIPCDEQGIPLAPVSEGFRIRPGYRYRTRDGRVSGYLRTLPDPDYSFFDPDAGRSFRSNGVWIDDYTPHNEDLVEEITPTTIEEWLHTIPESEAALRNMEIQDNDYRHDSVRDAADAIEMAFSWSVSPEGHAYWQEVHRRLVDEWLAEHNAAEFTTRARAAFPSTPPPPPPAPPPAPKLKYRITEVRHYFLEAEDEIEADSLFRNASDPARKFRMHIEDREIHNDA